jgi:hypothetical protein
MASPPPFRSPAERVARLRRRQSAQGSAVACAATAVGRAQQPPLPPASWALETSAYVAIGLEGLSTSNTPPRVSSCCRWRTFTFVCCVRCLAGADGPASAGAGREERGRTSITASLPVRRAASIVERWRTSLLLWRPPPGCRPAPRHGSPQLAAAAEVAWDGLLKCRRQAASCSGALGSHGFPASP